MVEIEHISRRKIVEWQWLTGTWMMRYYSRYVCVDD